MKPKKEKYRPGYNESDHIREAGMRKIKALKRLAADRERKILETTSLGKLIK